MTFLRIVNLTAQAARIHARASTSNVNITRSFASSAINQGPRTLATPLASTIITTPKPSQAELAEHYSKFLDGEDIYENNKSKVATHVITHYPVEEVLMETSKVDTVPEQVQQKQSNSYARDSESDSFGTYNSNGNNVYFVDGRVALA